MNTEQVGKQVSVSKIFKLLPELRRWFDENEFSGVSIRTINASEFSKDVEIKTVRKHWWSRQRKISSREMHILSGRGSILGQVGYVDNRFETEAIGEAILRVSKYIPSQHKGTPKDIGFLLEIEKEGNGSLFILKFLPGNIVETINEIREECIRKLFQHTHL